MYNNKEAVITFTQMLVSAVILLVCSGVEGFPSNDNRVKRQVTIDEVGTEVGCLKTRSHKVSGKVYFINNSSQLYIKDFTFDGLGFGVYFYVALEGTQRPFSRKNSVVVNWPDPLSEERTPIKRAFDKQDVVINLPADISSDKVKWLSLWCEEFNISFGDLAFKSKKPKENACAPGAKKAQQAFRQQLLHRQQLIKAAEEALLKLEAAGKDVDPELKKALIQQQLLLLQQGGI